MAVRFWKKLRISRTLALKDVASLARKRRPDYDCGETVNAIRESLLRDDNIMMLQPGKKDQKTQKKN